jgi:hypothetical protein
MVKRWRDRVGGASREEIERHVKQIAKNGTKYELEEENHYRACYNGICVVFLELSPLHSLAKTVYDRDIEGA